MHIEYTIDRYVVGSSNAVARLCKLGLWQAEGAGVSRLADLARDE